MNARKNIENQNNGRKNFSTKMAKKVECYVTFWMSCGAYYRNVFSP